MAHVVGSEGGRTFDENVAQDGETVEIKLPKGPASFCSPRVNGKVPNQLPLYQRTYAVTVEPNAFRKLVRRAKVAPCDRDERKRHSLPTDSDPAEVGAVSEATPPTVADAMLKRKEYFAKARFRQRRADVLASKKMFPSLATPKFVPEWRECKEHYSEEMSYSVREQAQVRLNALTLVGAVRQQQKKYPSPERSWLPHIDAKAAQKACERGPALFHSEYSPTAEIRFREESEEAKLQWMGGRTLVPVNLTQAKASIARPAGQNGMDVFLEIDSIRNQGRANNEVLQCRYEKKAEAFKEAQERRGPLSNFALRELREHKKHRGIRILEAVRNPPARKSEDYDANQRFKERMSIGFSRYRSGTDALLQ
jgi:hypothetical protein